MLYTEIEFIASSSHPLMHLSPSMQEGGKLSRKTKELSISFLSRKGQLGQNHKSEWPLVKASKVRSLRLLLLVGPYLATALLTFIWSFGDTSYFVYTWTCLIFLSIWYNKPKFSLFSRYIDLTKHEPEVRSSSSYFCIISLELKVLLSPDDKNDTYMSFLLFI